jgi:hypothetical protein
LDLELEQARMWSKFFKRGKSVMWSNHFKGPAMQQHATGWHECGVSRVDAQGKIVCSGVTVAVKTVHVIVDRIVI